MERAATATGAGQERAARRKGRAAGRSADLTGADLCGADVSRADLSESLCYARIQINAATDDSRTNRPSGDVTSWSGSLSWPAGLTGAAVGAG
jgi:hypothetical protein